MMELGPTFLKLQSRILHVGNFGKFIWHWHPKHSQILHYLPPFPLAKKISIKKELNSKIGKYN